MSSIATLPTHQSMKAAHRVRRFRRGNVEHTGSTWRTRHNKPWKIHNTLRSTAA